MPHTILINSEHTRVVIQFSGNITGTELIAINGELIKNTDYISQIWDYLSADKIEISLEEMHKISIQDSSLSQNSKLQKVAIVVTEELARGLDKIYEQFSEDWVGRPHRFDSKSFRTLDEATEWILSNETQK